MGLPLTATNQPIPLRATATGDFARWLSEAGGSLVVSTYRSNLLAFVSWDGQQVSLLFRPANRPMGLATQGRLLGVVTRDQVQVYADAPPLAPHFEGLAAQPYDSLYLPRLTYHTGELQIHDLAWGSDGLCMVNTAFRVSLSRASTSTSRHAGSHRSFPS